jgi:hypothetical protein
MSKTWDQLIQLQDKLIQKFNAVAVEVQEPEMDRFNQPGWINRVWTNNIIRRAHIDVVDARQTKGLWMMHVCVFPQCNDTAPIYGLDVIAGEKKVTGYFHDFSPTVAPNHTMIVNFGKTVSNYNWKKERTLPDWATAIFSSHMLAVGNVNTEEELNSLIKLSLHNLDEWLCYYRHTTCDPELGKAAQNKYAHYQKQNPHTPRTMKALGLNEDDVDFFIQKCLFPEI